jgi:hypothetical protein
MGLLEERGKKREDLLTKEELGEGLLNALDENRDGFVSRRARSRKRSGKIPGSCLSGCLPRHERGSHLRIYTNNKRAL